MAKILGITVSDQQARDFNARDINGRIQILQFIGRSDLIDKAIDQYAGEAYGYLGGALKNGEIKSIIHKAAREGWSPERIQGAIVKTKYWKSHTAAEREWDQLKATDPAEVKKRVANAKGEATRLANQLGITVGGGRLSKLAEKAAREGMSAEAIARLVADEAQYAPDMTGAFGSTIDEVIKRANDYLLPMSEQTAFTRAKAILTGNDTMEGTQSYLVNMAKARWGHLTEELDKGYTVRDLIQPNIEETARLLEVDPDTIDPLDQRFVSMVDYVDPDTGKHRTQSYQETAQMVRRLDDYWQTRGAEDEAAKFARDLAAQFGKAS